MKVEETAILTECCSSDVIKVKRMADANNDGIHNAVISTRVFVQMLLSSANSGCAVFAW